MKKPPQKDASEGGLCSSFIARPVCWSHALKAFVSWVGNVAAFSCACVRTYFPPQTAQPMPGLLVQIMNVGSTTLSTPEFQTVRAACLNHVASSFNATQEYVVTTFEVQPCCKRFPGSAETIC